MADDKKMSLEDILAACRDSDGGEGAAGSLPTAETAPASSPGPAEASASKPPAGKAVGGSDKPAGEMSMADILAAARGATAGGDGGAGAAQPKPASKSKPKPKPSAKKPAPAKGSSGPMDTSSILAAARTGTKPGPISKTEAAQKPNSTAAKPKRVAPPMPAKPAYAMPPAKPAEESDRRGFFSALFGTSLALGFTSLGLTTVLWTLGAARFMFPNILIEPPNKFKVGVPSDFAPGSVAAKFKAQFGVWIVNAEYDGMMQIVALKTVCTHLGCTPNWLEAEQKFKCPCHGSGFYKDGVNFEGPAPRPLERYAIRVADDGQLEIDKSKTFKQEIGQWTDTTSFVSV